MTTMQTGTEKLVACWKCTRENGATRGDGRYYFRSGKAGACFACDGTGMVAASARPASAGGAVRPMDAERARCLLAVWYRKVRAGEMTMGEILESAGWRLEGLEQAFAVVPGARAAFARLGALDGLGLAAAA